MAASSRRALLQGPAFPAVDKTISLNNSLLGKDKPEDVTEVRRRCRCWREVRAARTAWLTRVLAAAMRAVL